MDPAAAERFRRLYARWGAAVLAYAVRRVPSRADADDVLAETFVVCWRRLADAPPDDDDVLPWLYAVAGRVVANQQRGNERRLRLVHRLQSQSRSEVDPGVTSEDVAALHDAIAQLRPEERELLRLSAWEQLEPAQLAVVLDCSANAAAIRLHRARKALREAFASQRDEGGGATTTCTKGSGS